MPVTILKRHSFSSIPRECILMRMPPILNANHFADYSDTESEGSIIKPPFKVHCDEGHIIHRPVSPSSRQTKVDPHSSKSGLPLLAGRRSEEITSPNVKGLSRIYDFANYPICPPSSESGDDEGIVVPSSSLSSSEGDEVSEIEGITVSARNRGSTTINHAGVTYTLLSVLGCGGFAKVVQASTSLGEQVAMKICRKKTSKNQPLKFLRGMIMNERDILVKTANAKRPFLTQPLACFQDSENVYFVMRMYSLNLSQLIHSHVLQSRPRQIKVFAAELLLGLESLHKMGVVHRDLKPDNIMVTANGHLAVGDFGLGYLFAHEVRPTVHMTKGCGSTGYMSPEVLSSRRKQEGYTSAVDIWGYGMILIEMHLGRRCIDPDGEEADVLNKTLPVTVHGEIDIEVGTHDTLAADLLHRLLSVDASDRPSWAAIRRHAYFADIDWDAVEAREVKGDLPEMVIKLEPCSPPPELRGRKVEFEDGLLNFDCRLSDRVDLLHGWTFLK